MFISTYFVCKNTCSLRKRGEMLPAAPIKGPFQEIIILFTELSHWPIQSENQCVRMYKKKYPTLMTGTKRAGDFWYYTIATWITWYLNLDIYNHDCTYCPLPLPTCCSFEASCNQKGGGRRVRPPPALLLGNRGCSSARRADQS